MTPRLRLVAGPNGSGKTSLTRWLVAEYRIALGHYINPDDIAAELAGEIADPMERALAAQKVGKMVRETCLEARANLTYESVMSHSSHLEFIRRAKTSGFRTYLYYIGVCSPEICVERVRMRNETGGHDVPEDKIRGRYDRSLAHLAKACRSVDRAFIFDNSGDRHLFLAEVDAGILHPAKGPLPHLGWYEKALLEQWPARKIAR